MQRRAPDHFVDGYLPAMLAQASHLISGEFHRVVTENGFSVSEWRVLATLAGNDPMSNGRVAHISVTKPSTVTRILDRMEMDGWVKREPSREDRRMTLVSITPAGDEKVSRLIELAQEHERRVLEPLGAEHAEALKAMLRSIVDLHRPG